MAIPQIKLNDGASIPQLGFGTWQVKTEDAAELVRSALESGYRHIDTAQMYRNEKGVGAGVAASGLAREEVFVTSKLNNGLHEADKAAASIRTSLADLGLKYLDLFLIHWPLPTLYDGDFVSTWKALLKMKEEGLARSVGVSNFQVAHLQRLAKETTVVPAVNQIEVHPYLNNDAVRAHNREQGIVTEAWSPLGQGKVLEDPVIQKIAARSGKSAAQVVLRWHIQRGDVVFPKSSSPERLRENFAIFDFELGAADVAAISALDRGEEGRIGPNPDVFAMIPSS